ncbi:unnamed protein product [Rhodiola kirilowii]
MEEASNSGSKEKEISEIVEEDEKVVEVAAAVEPSGGGGWGGWGFSAFSVLSDLQKAATVAAEEISRNASVVAQTAAKSLAELQNMDEESETSSKEEEHAGSETEEKTDDESDKLRKLALDKLENASEDSLLGQGLKVLDHSVENFASGAWQALGSAFKGGSDLVHKLEKNLSESIQPGAAGSMAPSLLETGKALTTKGIQVLEHVGKETMDLLIAETGIQIDKESKEDDALLSEDQLFEEVTFDRCFYIYGGPEQLEELEALSSHHTLLFNRRKAKLSSQQKSVYDGKLQEVQHIFSSAFENDGGPGIDKGKKVESGSDGCSNEMKNLHDSSICKAADMAAGFTSALTGLSANDMIQRTVGRLESLHSEGVHRLSEMCCLAISQLLMLGKSVIANANKVENEENDEDMIKIDWPEDSIEKAKIIRTKTQSMTSNVEAVSSSFVTGILEVVEAFQAALKNATAESHEVPPKKSIDERASSFSEHLKSNQITAVEKIMEGLQFLSYVVISTSIPSA